MQYEPRFDIFALFMVLGVFQGIFIAYIFLSSPQNRLNRNIFYGLFFVVLVILNSEILLNYSGIIVKVLFIENYSEPFVFLVSPLVYFIIREGLNDKYKKRDWIHFFPFIAYFVYSFFYFIQPAEFKYNSYVYCYQPQWPNLNYGQFIPDDPLDLRQGLFQLYLAQFVIYILLINQFLQKYKSENKTEYKSSRKTLQKYRWSWILLIMLTIVVLVVKLSFKRDLGDYIIGSFLSLVIYISSFFVVKYVLPFSKQKEVNEQNAVKYSKSTLDENRKNDILNKLTTLFEEKKYFMGNTISLGTTSKEIGEQTHHVSQVINEKMNMGFFDLLAEYRVKEAIKLLLDPGHNNYTIEDIAEQVGYNSKAAFNKSFKKITCKTPSTFRAS